MANIYKIETEYRDLISVLVENGGELTPEIEQALQINQKDLYRKSESYAYAIKELSGEIDIIKSEIERLQALISKRDKSISRMKETVLKAMELYEIDKIETPMIKISVRESEAVEVINENQIEPIFKVEKVTTTISKSAIKEAIKSGINVNGVVIKKNKSLQIK